MSTPTTPAPARPDDATRRLQGRLMAQSLGRLLDQVRGARDVLPHLGALERGLLDEGSDVIARIPMHGLAKMCSQLSSLPIPENDPPLQDLLDRLLRELGGAQRPRAAGGDFDPERTVVIREITHSAFMAAAAEQASTLHGGDDLDKPR